jgi:hypothetical protein
MSSSHWESGRPIGSHHQHHRKRVIGITYNHEKQKGNA